MQIHIIDIITLKLLLLVLTNFLNSIMLEVGQKIRNSIVYSNSKKKCTSFQNQNTSNIANKECVRLFSNFYFVPFLFYWQRKIHPFILLVYYF